MDPGVRGDGAAEVLGQLSQLLHRQDCVPDALQFYHAAFNQELLSNSAHPCGLALPHARGAGIRRLQFALGRAAKPVTWFAKGSHPVRLVFLIAVPATDAVAYLHLLSALAGLAKQQAILRELLAAPGTREILTVLGRVCGSPTHAEPGVEN
jgi:PTS system fructose-specific IIC component